MVYAERAVARADELTRMANTSFALTLLDMATTRLSITHTNGVESNPIARPFVRSDVGALGFAVLATAFERTIFRKHPRAFVGVDGMHAYASVHNYISRLRALDLTHTAEQAARTIPADAAENNASGAKEPA